MKRLIGTLLVLLAGVTTLRADGKTDPGYAAAYAAAEKGQRVRLAIGPDTVSTCPLRCGSIDGYADGVVEVYRKADGSVGWSAVKTWAAVRSIPYGTITPTSFDSFPFQPGCPSGVCPNQRSFR